MIGELTAPYEKSETVVDWLKITFMNLDGDVLVVQKIDFEHTKCPGYIDCTVQRPCELVRKSVPESCYTEDFKFQAAEWFKVPVSEINVTWVDKL